MAVDLQVIVMKVFNHFSIYTVRVSNLKSFCQYVDVEFKNLLSHSKTRWLSLLPALERILDMFEPLKAYFLSLDNAPTILTKFFQNSMSLFYQLKANWKANFATEKRTVSLIRRLRICLTQIQFLKRKVRFSFTMLATFTQKVLTISKSGLRISLNSPL